MTKQAILTHLRALAAEGLLTEKRHGPHRSFVLADGVVIGGGDEGEAASGGAAAAESEASEQARRLFFHAVTWLVLDQSSEFATAKGLERAMKSKGMAVSRTIMETLTRRLQEYGVLHDTVAATRHRGR